MLFYKESNYIRLKRAKIDLSMFDMIKKIGVGAFGKVRGAIHKKSCRWACVRSCLAASLSVKWCDGGTFESGAHLVAARV